jgi:hypothetical protein
MGKVVDRMTPVPPKSELIAAGTFHPQKAKALEGSLALKKP